jgi:hypothetical protein
MTEAIKPRTTQIKQSTDELTRRYVFYPLRRLTFFENRVPLYSPVLPRAEIVLVEAQEYAVPRVGSFMEGDAGKNDIWINGTQAQVNYLMGNRDVGYMVSGMTYLDNLDGYDADKVIQIRDVIYPDNKIPTTLLKLREHLEKVRFSVDGPLRADVTSTIDRMLDGIQRAISYCNDILKESESEISDSKTGNKMAMKSGLSQRDRYMYHQIGRPLPEDRSGVNMAQELGKILAGAIGAPQLDPQKDLENEMAKRELEALRKEVEEKDKLIKELAGYETEPSE